MNSRFILTQSREKVKPDLTVPSVNSDIRLVAESNENRPVKRRGFRKPAAKMAKDLKTDQSKRPARRIKLNRSIFNTESTAKPTIHVKTLNEIKSEKKASKDPVKLRTEVSVKCVVRNRPSVVSNASLPARSIVINASTSSDTRTVIKRENTTPPTTLLVPTFKLKLMTKDEYRRSISNQSNSRRIINRVESRDAYRQTRPQTVFTQQPQGSPVKKRKVSPIRLKLAAAPSLTGSPSKRCKISPIQSPITQVENAPLSPQQPPSPLRPPSPLDSPPSPALSLGAQSDIELESEMSTAIANPRVVILSKSVNTELHQKQRKKPVQSNNVHSRLGLPRTTSASQQSNTATDTFTDDCLDIMSVIADDDELFHEDKQNGLLKRTLSQDSIFSMADESNPCGNIRSLAKRKQKNPKHSVGDLITNKPMSRSFRIPRQNSAKATKNNSDSFSKRITSENSVKHRPEGSTPHSWQKGGDPYKDRFFHESHRPPKPTRVVSKDSQPLNGFSYQEKVRTIQRNLRAKNIQKAWSDIQELDDSNSAIDTRVLEEAVKVCEIVSVKEATPKLAEIVLSIFEVLKCRGALKPMAYILTVLTLCRCGMFQEGFDKLSAMLDAKTFLPQEILLHFVNDLLKCLQTNPKWIFELLPYVKKFNFSNPTHVVNNCLSSLVSAPVDVLKEITTSQWDSLISMLCVPPNAQGAMQVQNIMEKHCISMSDQSITKLLILYRDTKCTKQLLDLAHLKCTNETFDIGPIFADKSLKLSDVEGHIVDLFKTNSLPREDIVCHFIDKASAMSEYNMIYDVFLKCKASSVSLPVKILKKMVDVLENWEENMTASVEVYSALRDQAKKAARKEPKSTPPTNMPQKTNMFQHRRCISFMKTGQCRYGSRCWFSHVVDESPQFRRNSDASSPQSVGEALKSDDSDGKSQRKPKTPADFISTNTPMVNGHSTQQFPSFPRPSFVVPMFNPIQNHTPVLRLPLRHPQPTARLAFPNRFPPKIAHPTTHPTTHPNPHPTTQPTTHPTTHTTPRFATHNSHRPQNMPAFRSLSHPRLNTPVNIKLNRSFSWEPGYDTKPTSPLPRFQSPSSIDSNNNKSCPESQQRLDVGVASRDWKSLHLWYVESKEANCRTVHSSDLRLLRNAFVKDITTISSNFNAFVDYIREVKDMVKRSDDETPNSFDHYDVELLGSLGVSLMEKCLVAKKFDKGYEILHTLHTHNISYFDCGRNFGAYIRDIPPSAVAIIAVKLCIGMSQEDGLLGAVEVLRASNYAMPEDNITPENMEYRIKVLQQLFKQLFDQGNISEAYEIVQHLNASPNVMISLYDRVLEHYVNVDDFDQSFGVVNEMHEKGVDVNNSQVRSVYKKFLKLCLTNEQDDEAVAAVVEMDSREITLGGEEWQEILEQATSSTSDMLVNMIFQHCLDLGVYPATFFRDTPWLCQLGCGNSRVEMKLLIVHHLKQLHQYLLQDRYGNICLSTLKEFQITLFPRVAGGNQRLNGGIESAINQNTLVVAKVLQEDLNPPLMVSEQAQEQFHSEFIVEPVSLYRWLNANGEDKDDEDGVSNASIESCLSDMTRMTEFD